MNSKKYIKNREDLIGLGALFQMYELLIFNIYNTHGIWNLPKGFYLYILIIFSILIRTIPSYYGYKNSQQLNRNKFIWSIICFLTPFWGLIILSKLDYKFQVNVDECKRILKEFKVELKKLNYDKYWKEITKEVYHNKRIQLERTFNTKLFLTLNN